MAPAGLRYNSAIQLFGVFQKFISPFSGGLCRANKIFSTFTPDKSKHLKKLFHIAAISGFAGCNPLGFNGPESSFTTSTTSTP